jgi:hypothetical protein
MNLEDGAWASKQFFLKKEEWRHNQQTLIIYLYFNLGLGANYSLHCVLNFNV